MTPSARTQDRLLALLAAAAVGASGYAMWAVNRPVVSSPEAPANSLVAPRPIAAEEDAPSTAYPDDVGVANEPATEAASPSPTPGSPDSTEPVDAVTSEVSVEGWWSAAADDGSGILVLGDGFSSLPTQWIQLWGTQVARERPVVIHHWGEAADVTFNDPIVLSDGVGPALTIWSAGRRGSTIGAATERLDRFLAEAGEVDAVLVTLGQSSRQETVPEALDTLVGAIDADTPVLITVPPVGLVDDAVAEAIANWAEGSRFQVALVDLREAAPPMATAEQWALAFAAALANP